MSLQTEIVLMEKRLSTMEDKLTHVENKLDSMDKKLNQVIEALKGNPFVKDNGIVGKVEEIQTLVDQHELSLKKVKWFWAGVIFVSGIVVTIIELIKK